MSWIRPLVFRDVTSSHRASTSLELFYDLCFVVAVAAIATQLHHTAHDGEPLLALGRYLILFVPLWWAWMTFTWFATTFDNDDLVYRLTAFGMMLGILALASAVPRTGVGDFAPYTIAYVTVRICIASGYWRAKRAADSGDVRRYAHRYLVGYTGAGLLWTASLLLPAPWLLLGWATAMAAELATPVWAVAAARRQVAHYGHITERYQLFTLIVLGEALLAAAATIATGAGLIAGISGFAIACAIWWLYFAVRTASRPQPGTREAFYWGYGHLGVFSAIAAVGAGWQLLGDAIAAAHHGTPGDVRLVVGSALVVFLLSITFIHGIGGRGRRPWILRIRLAGAALIALLSAAAGPLPATVFGAAVAAILVSLTIAQSAAAALGAPRPAMTPPEHLHPSELRGNS